ncbi:MAG: hypothetical protein LBB36_03975 [Fibromonadaceae bacterium]|nr:hypothetical protein [Fibromonadaceae bacterium]
MNIDTVFNLKNGGVNKIFAYSFLIEDFDTSFVLWHKWYNGSELVKNVRCKMEKSACYSSISADSLKEGEWSVDTRQNDSLLLDIKQFRIENF